MPIKPEQDEIDVEKMLVTLLVGLERGTMEATRIGWMIWDRMPDRLKPLIRPHVSKERKIQIAMDVRAVEAESGLLIFFHRNRPRKESSTIWNVEIMTKSQQPWEQTPMMISDEQENEMTLPTIATSLKALSETEMALDVATMAVPNSAQKQIQAWLRLMNYQRKNQIGSLWTAEMWWQSIRDFQQDHPGGLPRKLQSFNQMRNVGLLYRFLQKIEDAATN